MPEAILSQVIRESAESTSWSAKWRLSGRPRVVCSVGCEHRAANWMRSTWNSPPAILNAATTKTATTSSHAFRPVATCEGRDRCRTRARNGACIPSSCGRTKGCSAGPSSAREPMSEPASSSDRCEHGRTSSRYPSRAGMEPDGLTLTSNPGRAADGFASPPALLWYTLRYAVIPSQGEILDG